MPILSLIKERMNTELEQASIRVLVGALASVFIGYEVFASGLTANSVRLLYAIGIFLGLAAVLVGLIVRSPAPSLARRLTGIVADMSALSISLYTLGEAGAVLFSLYLWVIVGNGLRFGKGYLYIAMACALLGFGVVSLTSDFWQLHPYITTGMLLGFVALPMYFSTLLTRLDNARANLENRVAERTAELAMARDHALAASLAKTQFLANMSHELRTPLNAILGYNEILQEKAAEENRGVEVADLKKIHEAGGHLLQMISEMLDLSKIEAGELNLKAEPVNIRELLHGIKEEQSPALAKNHNVMDLQIDPHLEVIVTDKLRLRQILQNLADNANKFTKNGSIELRASVGPENNGKVEFSVSDTGIGIAEQDLATLFTPFTQVDNTFTRRYEGSGLGLAISRNLSNMMGGEIRVRSAPGKGSTFTVTLPSRPRETTPVT